MVESGEIFAKISHKDGMVKFGTKPEKYNSVAMLRNLEKHVTGIIDVTDRIDRNNFQKVPFSNFSCMFPNPNNFFQFEF